MAHPNDHGWTKNLTGRHLILLAPFAVVGILIGTMA